MKILLVTNMYPTNNHPFKGIFVKEQVESLRKEGIIVDVFVIKSFDYRSEYLRSFISLLKNLRSKHYDLIHTHHTFCVYPIMFARYLLSYRCPLVISFHEGEVLRDRTFKDANIMEKLLSSRKLREFALNRSDLIISVCEKLIHALKVKRDFVVLPCGVDLDLFRPMDKSQCRKTLGLPLDRKIVFFPADPKGRPEKGFDILERALQILDSREIFVVTAGNILHEEIPYYMNASDVVVQTSYFEASPMVIKEALATRVPIVSTDVGDTKEIIGNTEGCFISEREPISVAQNLRKALEFSGRTNGRERIIELGLSLDQVAETICGIYECQQMSGHTLKGLLRREVERQKGSNY